MGRKKVILIEDDHAICETITLVLESAGYEVTCFTTGALVTDAIMPIPDLFILDKNISGTNGMDLSRFIKSGNQYSRAPVLLITASPDIEQLAEACGADGFVRKPFTLKELRATVTRLLDKCGD
ncbi:response regulator [Sediminibacterium soli]|uniref:response regulator n=1 Tax=Sediminibacterium soli TaxID=2698829 RepID=UPI00137A57CD|nr:response regulator [Sediminibacterium soli]NCI45054.1 response regulator [Sediminibacterium soli]